MKKDENLISKLKEAFKSDYDLRLNDKQAKEATGNLVNFFYLLWRFDQQDKEKAMEMKGFKNESESL